MRVLVTRPVEDAKETAALLLARGHEPLIAPLLDIRFFDGELALDGVQAIAATSSNGVRAVARRTERRDLPLFAVGEKTADVARGLGFARIETGPGDAASLARSICGWARPDQGTILYAAGETDTGSFEPALAASGYSVRRDVLYAAVPAGVLPANARAAIAGRSLDAVLLFSPRTAHIFASLVGREELAACMRDVRICCISDAAAVGKLLKSTVCVAARPDQESLLRLLD